MKNIKLEKLTITHFKGSKHREIEFFDRTAICGKNGSGKTRVFDAFCFLLFGKDSQDRTDFNIKPLDENNQTSRNTDVEVVGHLDVSGQKHVVKRVFREKWQTPRGEAEAKFNGNETYFSWNDVPCSQTDFKNKVASIIDEQTFKLLTNPEQFMSLKWQDRRNVLFSIVGELLDEEAVGHIQSHETAGIVTKILSQGKKLDEFRREAAEKKKRMRIELEQIPSRIDEIKRLTPPEGINEDDANHEIMLCHQSIQDIDRQINDVVEIEKKLGEERIAKQNEINDLKMQIVDLKNKAVILAKSANSETESEILAVEAKIKQFGETQERINSEIKNLQSKIKDSKEKSNLLVIEYDRVFKSLISFTDNQFDCPTCKRQLENAEDRKKELTANFNRDKSENLSKIQQESTLNKGNTEALIEQLGALQMGLLLKTDEVKQLESKLSDLKSLPKTEPVYPEEISMLADKILSLEAGLNKTKPTESPTNQLTASRKKIQEQLESINLRLQINAQIKKSQIRIIELEEQAKSIGQAIADIEQQEYHIAKFIKQKIEMIDHKINALFMTVKFKMYRQLVNGGEEPCCDALINGVPYQDANNAAKINAGLDIINALSKHYNVAAPVFVDNAESVNNVLPTLGQQVLLIVNESPELGVFNAN